MNETTCSERNIYYNIDFITDFLFMTPLRIDEKNGLNRTTK